MKSKSQSVKMRVNGENREVGVATYQEFDAVAEAVDEIGEEKVLELVNAQVRTNEMNRVRGLARGGPSKTQLRNKALARITGEEFQQCAGDIAAIGKLIAQKMEEVKEETLAAVGAGSSDDDEGDDDTNA